MTNETLLVALLGTAVFLVLFMTAMFGVVVHVLRRPPRVEYIDQTSGLALPPPEPAPPPSPPKCEIVTFVYDDGSTREYHSWEGSVPLADLTDEFGASLEPDKVLVEKRGGSHYVER